MSAWRSWIRFQHIHRRLDVICRHVVAGREMHAEQDLRAFDPVNCARCGDDRGAQIGAPASPISRSSPIHRSINRPHSRHGPSDPPQNEAERG